MSVRWTADRMDQLEHAAREGLRVALSRRGTEYIVVALRVTSADRHEVLIGRLPMTGEDLDVPPRPDRQLPGDRVSSAAILHLDESCLGNGREGQNPGGGGGLIEARSGNGSIHRRDFYISSPATTNNRMALASAVAALQLLAGKGARLPVLIVSDSQYLVKGMREWVPGWVGRGWRRKEGPIENLELWKALVASARLHDVQWTWVRGHKGHAKNEYANDLAVLAAKEQRDVGRHRGVGIRRVADAQASEGALPGLRPRRCVRRAGGAAAVGRPVRAERGPLAGLTTNRIGARPT